MRPPPSLGSTHIKPPHQRRMCRDEYAVQRSHDRRQTDHRSARNRAWFRTRTMSLGGGKDIFLDRSEQEDELRDYERFLCASGEALVYAVMIRLMVRRLARL